MSKKLPSLGGRRKPETLLKIILAAALAGGIGPGPVVDAALTQTQAGDWPAYGRDAGGSRYSPLDQINRTNVGKLAVAWTYRTGAEEVKSISSKNAAFESTPILVDGLLYLTTPYNRVIALNPATGSESWSYDPQVARDHGYSELTSRGVSARRGRSISRAMFGWWIVEIIRSHRRPR
jgi:glucose dehydrogenase